MIEEKMSCNAVFATVRRSVVTSVVAILAAGISAGQDSPNGDPSPMPAMPTIHHESLGAERSFPPTEGAGATAATPGNLVHSDRVRRITLEQVKQQSANRMISPLARLGQLQIEAAKQHRLGVQADYFPKFGATFANLHYTDFLGQVATFRRPFIDSLHGIPIPLFNQNMTIATLTFTQPITPLFTIHQAVKIARADERIAMAKAGISVAKNTLESEVEKTYFKLLIAQRRLTSAGWKVKSIENQRQYAAASIASVCGQGPELELMEARKALGTVAAEVKALTASLNQTMGWPEDTELELATPEPLVESISLDGIADKSAASNPDVVEAEQTVIKARAAFAISKLAYVPTVAAVSGFTFQNAIPLVPSSFGYGGVIASYNLFDFGKREHAVKEAHAQLEMAELGLQLTKAKVADNLKKSYFELERTRQLSQVAQKMGSSVGFLMNVSSTSESVEVKAARANVEGERGYGFMSIRSASQSTSTILRTTPFGSYSSLRQAPDARFRSIRDSPTRQPVHFATCISSLLTDLEAARSRLRNSPKR